MMHLNTRLVLLVRTRTGNVRVIKPGKWFIDRNTEVGEDADVYERMPHNGLRRIPWPSIVGNYEVEPINQDPPT